MATLKKLAVPKTWHELNELLWQHSKDESSDEYRPYIAFRGMGEDYGNLRTGIQRTGDSTKTYTRKELELRERRITDTFCTYAREDLQHGLSDWDVLLLGQHYRLPTRFLDWTSSPYVALYFATEDSDKIDKDGVVWCVKRVETNSVLPAKLARLRGFASRKKVLVDASSWNSTDGVIEKPRMVL